MAPIPNLLHNKRPTNLQGGIDVENPQSSDRRKSGEGDGGCTRNRNSRFKRDDV